MTPAKRTTLDRRTLLRGALIGGGTAAIPLPRLGIMLNENGTAYAAGDPLSKYFGVWFFGNGVRLGRWVPPKQGRGSQWELSHALAPLAKVKDSLTVVTGMELMSGHSREHAWGPCGMLTGANMHPEWHKEDAKGNNIGTDAPTVQLPSIDQVVAKLISKDTRFRSLEVAASRVQLGMGSAYDAISHNGKDSPNMADADPRSVFNRLFKQLPAGDGPGRLFADARRSVLDAVTQDARRLQMLVGKEDSRRIEQHLDGIRILEQRLAALPATACAAPIDPVISHPGLAAPRALDFSMPGDQECFGATPDPSCLGDISPEMNSLMADLTVAALSCDLTRVFSFMLNQPAAHQFFGHLGPEMNQDFHNVLCHTEPGDQPLVHRGVVYEMECLAVFLEKLQAATDGAGTSLLDRSCVLVTTDVSEGNSHGNYDWPILIAGKAKGPNGRLRGDLHHRSNGENTSKVLLTLANLMGANLTEYGLDTPGPDTYFGKPQLGRVTEELPAILG